MEYTLDKGALKYCQKNRELYLRMGEAIEPQRTDWRQVWDRVAFAILSANAPFESAVLAMRLLRWERDGQSETTIGSIVRSCKGIRGQQVTYVRRLSTGPEQRFTYLPLMSMSWDTYRTYLQDTVPGLGLTKATFAACLLYPTSADLACVDVHIHRLFTGEQSAPKNLSRKPYLAIEDSIRELGKRAELPTFLTQWALWDFARGRIEDHRIWPIYNGYYSWKPATE